jgi:RNA polymerase sigma factor (sigma-70 family)
LRRADEADFHALVSDRMDSWRRSAYLLCQDWHEADDLVSITITKLYRNWSKVARAGNRDAYIRKVLTRCWLTERGRAHIRRELLAAEPADQAWTPGDRISDRDLLDAPLRALGQGQRAVLVLRFYLDYSVEDTAALLAIAPGTVKSQTARGLRTLREALDRIDH